MLVEQRTYRTLFSTDILRLRLGFYMSLLWQIMTQTEYGTCSRMTVPSMK